MYDNTCLVSTFFNAKLFTSCNNLKKEYSGKFSIPRFDNWYDFTFFRCIRANGIFSEQIINMSEWLTHENKDENFNNLVLSPSTPSPSIHLLYL